MSLKMTDLKSTTTTDASSRNDLNIVDSKGLSSVDGINGSLKVVYENGVTTELFTENFCWKNRDRCYDPYENKIKKPGFFNALIDSLGFNVFDNKNYKTVKSNVSIISSTDVTVDVPVITKDKNGEIVTEGGKTGYSTNAIIPPDSVVCLVPHGNGYKFNNSLPLDNFDDSHIILNVNRGNLIVNRLFVQHPSTKKYKLFSNDDIMTDQVVKKALEICSGGED